MRSRTVTLSLSLSPLPLLAALAALWVGAACSNQGEGDFCDINAGNNDCQDGLQCAPAPGLSGVAGGNTDRCCPIPPATATTPTCMQGSVTFDAQTAVPDGFGAGNPVAEASVESGAVGSEASVDAAGDSAAEAAGDSAAEAGVSDATLESGRDGVAAADGTPE